MNSFYTYTQQHNCNQILKNSPFFSIYHKKIIKNSYIKSNNEIRGFYKDSILNDIVYFSSNGLKKNAIFRSKEIKLNPNQKNFVSYFKNLENDLLIFNLYSQKYTRDIIKNCLNKQEIIYN